MTRNFAAIACAIASALLFGASTPLAKSLGGSLRDGPAAPILLAGLLYLGSGLGLCLVRLVRDRGWRATGLAKGETRWLMLAILFGGILAPVALMAGLAHTSGTSASLLLNLEAVLTALIAWRVFREHTDRRVVVGMIAIVAGGIVLVWPTGATGSNTHDEAVGIACVALACLGWAIDNNLTRKVSASDALFLAGIKGLTAGVVNTLLALALGATLPSAGTASATMAVGLLGYGVSLVLFVLALRGLGTARTGAYFSSAPFIGAALSLMLLHETVPATFWIALALMAFGVWLHLTERHEHEHTHSPLDHQHRHVHDAHHQHTHDFPWDGTEPHAHPHSHAALTHTHAHFPDVHHRHRHK